MIEGPIHFDVDIPVKTKGRKALDDPVLPSIISCLERIISEIRPDEKKIISFSIVHKYRDSKDYWAELRRRTSIRNGELYVFTDIIFKCKKDSKIIAIVIREEKTRVVLGYLMVGPELDFNERLICPIKLVYGVNSKNKSSANTIYEALFGISQNTMFSFIDRKRIQRTRFFYKEADFFLIYPLAAECLRAIRKGENLFWAVLSFCKKAQKVLPDLRPVSIIDYFLYSRRLCLVSALNLYNLAGDESLYRRIFEVVPDKEDEELNIDLLIDVALAVLEEFGPQASDRDVFIGKIANGVQDFLWSTCPEAKSVFMK